MNKTSVEIEFDWLCSHIWAVSHRTVKVIYSLWRTFHSGLRLYSIWWFAKYSSFHCTAAIKNASSALHPGSSWLILCSQRFYQYVLLFHAFFNSHSLLSPSKGHIISLPSDSGTLAALLLLHKIFAGWILTTSTFVQEHRYNITLMISSSE